MDIIPASEDQLMTRISFFDDEIEKIYELDFVTGKIVAARNYVSIYPASHYATTDLKMLKARESIEKELEERLEVLRGEGKILEAYRLEQRTRYDLEMLAETGFTKGIENYSAHLAGRSPGTPPYTLIDFFPEDYLLFIDESHVAIPQIGAMYNGDRARKESLVNFGFRLPSAFDNRPLKFEEFEERMGQSIFVSATPSRYEAAHQEQIVEQIIRPTGLVDPQIAIHPVEGQIDDLISEIKQVKERGERTLVLTLTKRMSEDLSLFLSDNALQVSYLHSDLENDERLAVLRDLRSGKFDVLVGINLLREGLDLPEVSLIAILDADKQGFLRSQTSLIQIIGRAARNVNGKVIMYADSVTDAMMAAVSETNRRREIQELYNRENRITPTSIKKDIRGLLDTYEELEVTDWPSIAEATEDGIISDLENTVRGAAAIRKKLKSMKPSALVKMITELERDMNKAAKALEFEEAAKLRDLLIEAKGIQSAER